MWEALFLYGPKYLAFWRTAFGQIRCWNLGMGEEMVALENHIEALARIAAQLTAELQSDVAPQVVVLIHYGELGLKGKNRPRFEQQLLRNIKIAVRDLELLPPRRLYGRFLLPLPAERVEQSAEALARLQRVFGIATLAPGILVQQELAQLEQAAQRFAAFAQAQSFAVRVKRSQKNFPMSSRQLEAHLGALIQQATQMPVDLSNPEWTFHVELFDQRAVCYTRRLQGARGLPTGISGKAVALLSTGIDSPVAAWKLMKRGVRVIFAHFHSVPYTTPASLHNARKIVEHLTRWQLSSRLYLVPIAEIQKHIMLHIPAAYRIIFYRRTMYRLAEAIAVRERAGALITGESVGQVASQTLENLRAANEVVSLPVLRPLAGDDKEEIIALGKHIGTFELSLLPDEDCCTLFVPRQVVTRAKLSDIHRLAAQIDVQALESAALEAAEVIDIHYPAASQGG